MKRGTIFSNILPLGKKATVGVDIGYEHLRMVKINKASAQKREILDYLSIPLEPGMDNDSWFPEMLKSALHDFCGSPGRCEIWTAISMASFQMRHLRMPVVPKNQTARAVQWTYKQEVPMGGNGRIFDFRILGKMLEEGVHKLEAIAYTAPEDEIESVKGLFERIGFPLTGISVFPFFRQNLLKMNWVDNDGLSTCSLFIGKRRSHIDIFDFQGNLILSRGIRAGTNSMIEALKEELNSDFDRARNLFFQLLRGDEAHQDGAHQDGAPYDEIDNYIGPDLMIRVFLPALERLVRQVKMTIEHSSSKLRDKGVEKIFISGEMGAYKLLVDYIGIQLDLPMVSIDPFSGYESWDEDKIPQTPIERASFTPAVGMALSENPRTPNFIHTYKDKEKHFKMHRLNQVILGVFILLSLFLVGVDLWQGKKISEKKRDIERLSNRIRSLSPMVNKGLIAETVAGHRKNSNELAAYGRKFLVMAVIKEIVDLTPSNIKLLYVNADFGGETGKKSPSTVRIDGIVLGEKLLFETTLAGYLMALENSPVFHRQSLEDKSLEFLNSKEILRFTTLLELM